MNIKSYIPNTITLLNAFCGSIAAILAANNSLIGAAFFVFLGIFFDFFDGLAARKLGVQSELGVQLDSLADMITSGLVPGIVMYKLLAVTSETTTFSNNWSSQDNWFDFKLSTVALIGLLITVASLYRLAKFNIDENQKDSFIGLPTPANTLLILSLPLILEFQNSDLLNNIILNKWFLIALTLLSCYLLNCKLHLFALKFKDWSFKNNVLRYTFIAISLVLLIVLKFLGIPIIIFLYILLSLISNNS